MIKESKKGKDDKSENPLKTGIFGDFQRQETK